ncbi:pyridoxamine 5'-phosphate oxidase family protein [Tropicibacter oceani]|uniref:Pyridoxamine 5'-phosphate oxidase family protein n=1 Tax=Tropicibacter oceani TaxID=3058420 RepID=A0ABY8QIF3_9RHOB|nr:pyridoxamine 5'-phosphate oxidase family protein [Tropicibacter oceani]WGW03932.1 pyridoxamine 5'-phosphate oxidase family protein [Tropicibacter oceani]
MRKIQTLDDLHALYGEPVPLALSKVARQLTPLYRDWIEGSCFCVLSTVGPDGVHGSPRGDDGPVVRVQDPGTILMPDWWGNNRLDCLRDIVSDGRIALLFLVPGSTTTVRVNGRAFLTDDTDLRALFEKKGRQPATVVVITVDEVYTQCAKALLRSGIWGRDDSADVPTVGQILAEMTDGAEGGADYDAHYVELSKPRMW